jgi:sigma-B regulation protein RsbU (phosphoserine phosphatase)
MNLRGLFMALTVAKINHHKIVLSAAGMPPVLLYRAAEQRVEEIFLKALPLGGVANYRYQQVTFNLAAGDVAVLMSDGLPERFNEQNEMLGDEPIQALLMKVGTKTAADIIAALVQAGDDWAGTRAQDDDVTFVVVKVKE